MLTGFLRFWPWGSFVGQTNVGGVTDSLFTDPRDVSMMSSLEAIFRMDMGFTGPAGSTLTVTPQVSADGLAWMGLPAGGAFGPYAPGVPVTASLSLSPLLRWMRFQISVFTPAAGTYGGVFDINAIGRSN